MGSFVSILPGARVRADEGIIGTVERLEQRAEDQSDQPDHMIVRSEDGQWRYSIPLMLVRTVSQDTFHTTVYLSIDAADLPSYIDTSLATDSAVSDEETMPTLPSGEWTPPSEEETLRIPLAAEELTAYKQAALLGKVHLHKGVETVEQRLSVPVYREEAVIERIPPDQYDAGAPSNPNETIIPILEEQLVVEKRTVIKEYIRVRKNVIAEQRDVQDTVRREYVEASEERLDAAGSAPLLRVMPSPPNDSEPAASAGDGATP